MNKKILLLSLLLSLFACKKNVDYQTDNQTMKVNNFVWKAMNSYYLWKDENPNLKDDRFQNQLELNQYLDDYDDPEAFFESLIYDREHIDRWSWIVDDYVALLQYFEGVRKTTGMRIGLVREQAGSDYIFAYVKYVLPGSDAESKGIVRGNLFRKVNGQRLTVNNYRDLFNNDNLDIELATWNGSGLTDTGNIYNLLKSQLNENPVYFRTTINYAGKKVGYLMYNGFTSTYDGDLNDAIGYFKSENVDELVLDLRYNPGGSVATMQYLASMLTGQFTGQPLLNYQWHNQRQEWMQDNSPEKLRRYFVNQTANGNTLNHLNLNKLYVIATGNSASASESLMNCLEPYIDVIHIGTPTHGKYTASVTLFDSPDFSYKNVNPDHKWAIQPIVLKVSNAQGVTDFINGLQPDVLFPEDYFNMGVLGTSTEPLLQRCLQHIANGSILQNRQVQYEEIYYKELPYADDMRIDVADLK